MPYPLIMKLQKRRYGVGGGARLTMRFRSGFAANKASMTDWLLWLSLSLSLSPTTDSHSQHEVSNVSTILAPLVLSKFHTMREKLGENHWHHSFLRFSLRRVAPTLPDHCDTNLFRLLTFPSSPYTGQLDVSCDSHFTLYGESFSSHISTLCSGLASR